MLIVTELRTLRVVVDALALGRRELRRSGMPIPAELDALLATLAAQCGPERPEPTAAEPADDAALVSYSEAGRRLGVSERTVRRHVALGQVPAVRIGRRVLLRLADVEELGGIRHAG